MRINSDRLNPRATVVVRTALALCLAASVASSPAAAGDTYSSTARPTYGVWNPGGPSKCKWFADQYNAQTPKIQAAYASRKNAEAQRLTEFRETFKTKYQLCVEGKLLPPFNVTGTINAPGAPSGYPPPQQGYAAGPAGSLTGGTSGGGAAGNATGGGGKPWTGSATLPAFTSSTGVRYNQEQLQISIGDYIHHSKQKNYSTKVPLIYGSGQFTHAIGTVNTVTRTFTVRQVRDNKSGKNVTVSPVVVPLQ